MGAPKSQRVKNNQQHSFLVEAQLLERGGKMQRAKSLGSWRVVCAANVHRIGDQAKPAMLGEETWSRAVVPKLQRSSDGTGAFKVSLHPRVSD